MTEQLAAGDEFEIDSQPFDIRNLVISGGRPYILITVVEPEIGGVHVDHFGLNPDVDLPGALQEIALLLAEGEG